MAVHLHKDGRWFVQYVNPEWPEKKPRLKREYCGRGPQGEAEARAADALIKARKKKPEGPPPTFFAEIAQAYITAKANDAAKTTIENLQWKLAGVILPTLGSEVFVQDITPDMMDAYTRTRIEDGVSKTTIHGEIGYIITILNWAEDRGLIYRHRLQRYKKPARDDEILKPPTPEEVRAIINHSPPHLIRAIVISFYTGIRPGASELFGLKWDDVDLKGNFIFVRSAKKGGRKTRKIFLTDDFLNRLKEWRKADDGKVEYLITWRGKSVSSVKKAFQTAKRKAGITRRIRLYDLRHSFVTALLAEGADLKAVSEIVGHSRVDTTLKTYQHVNEEMHRETMKKLPSL